MSFILHNTGKTFIASRLAGADDKINGMYVEYGTSPISAGSRTLEYYINLGKSSMGGYGRIAITNSYVDKDNTIHFDALLCKSDLIGAPLSPNSVISCATLINMVDTNCTNDILICTVDFKSPVRLLEDTYTTIHTSMKLGA